MLALKNLMALQCDISFNLWLPLKTKGSDWMTFVFLCEDNLLLAPKTSENNQKILLANPNLSVLFPLIFSLI